MSERQEILISHFPVLGDETHQNWGRIPDYMRGAVTRYVLHGISPGSFLTAVLSNNLKEAVSRADDTNIEMLPQYIKFLYNNTPGNCWGSNENVAEWCAEIHKGKNNE